ncbi:hypothetical protein Poli38472_011552 [Pythium oligandrum]|uniref:Heme haloperoxidase family profile domain-containing protein n=1 Tax=Pythium oligandrum TaxID=41045 RepID=A0A8K1CJM0_PYTOL|nr:hypothetical protein Poli38472_011552 [Pythium oligandrum]|eukprot:TMW64672.1 hypothetical protein Poli38472_011552 [Pythium oligandrum]
MRRKREALDTANEAAYAARGVRLLQEASRAATAPVDAIVETGSNAKRQRLGSPKEEGKEHEVSAVSAVGSGDSVVGAVAVASEREDETWDAGAFRNEIDELRRKNDYLAQEIDALRQHITNRDESSAFVDARDGRLAMIDEHDPHRTVHAYQERLRSGLKLIRDSLSKMEESLKNTDASRSPENRTTQELQTFHAECNRQMTALLRRLDDVTSPPVTETGVEHKEPEPSAFEQGDVYQMHLASVEPRWAQVERGLAQRMSYFSTQLDHLRVQVSKMEQDLMQENELNTRRLENMLAQQMAQSRQQHSVETKRLQPRINMKILSLVALLSLGVPAIHAADDAVDLSTLAEGEYYRPEDASGGVDATNKVRRSPCPAINTLANHGYIPRDGMDISTKALRDAVVKYYNIDEKYAQVLMDLFPDKSVLSLNELSDHDVMEHDMSLVHADAFYDEDPATVDKDLQSDLFNHVGVSDAMESLFFARTRQRRLEACLAQNPKCDADNSYLTGVALGWIGLLMRAMGGKNEDNISSAYVKDFLIDEKFPDDYAKPTSAITQNDVQVTRRKVYSLLKSTPDWLTHGFASSNSAIISESDSTLCVGIKGASIESGALVYAEPCDSKDASQQFTMDEKNRLVVQHTKMCVDVYANGDTDGAEVKQNKCNDQSNQKWLYDASGRLHPAHAPTMCLSFESVKGKGAFPIQLAACGDAAEQRFYSIYGDFKPESKHISVVASPELCIRATTSGSVEVTECDPQADEQEISIGMDGKIVFSRHKMFLTTAKNGDIRTVASDNSDSGSEPMEWHYDSLGRLHPSTDEKNMCLSQNGKDDKAVVLAECSDDVLQKWYAVDKKDIGTQQVVQPYYHPTASESSGKPGNKAKYSRSPCPVVNALANHGLISRDGRNITREALVSAINTQFNIATEIVDDLLTDIKDSVLSLDDLSKVRHDSGLLLRGDDAKSDDPALFDTALVDEFFTRVGSSGSLQLMDFASAIARGQANCSSSCSLDSEIVQGSVHKAALLFLALGGASSGSISSSVAQSMLSDERVSDELIKPVQNITSGAVNSAVNKITALLSSSSSWLAGGFALSKQPLFNVINGTELCLTLPASDDRTQFEMSACNSPLPTDQQFTYDSKHRIVSASSGQCLDVFGLKQTDGAEVVQVECNDMSNQRWTYDASGRLHPGHAPQLCLAIDSSNSGVVISTCSSHANQVFFSTFNSFELKDKQLASSRAPAPLTECLEAQSGGKVGVATCDSSESSQLWTLDGSKQLTVSSKCLTVGDNNAVMQADCNGASKQQWFYDSLGHLHPQSDTTLCLDIDTQSSATVDFCATRDAQRWLATSVTTTGDGETGGPAPSTASRRHHGPALALILAVIHILNQRLS